MQLFGAPIEEGNAGERCTAFCETRLRSYINCKPACILLACTRFATPKRELGCDDGNFSFPKECASALSFSFPKECPTGLSRSD